MQPNHHCTAIHCLLVLAFLLFSVGMPFASTPIPQTGFLEGAYDEPIAVTSGRHLRMNTTYTTTLSNFVTTLTANATSGLVGVYADGVLALPVIQQPTGQAGFVSTQNDTVTQFGLANRFGTIGLLAHNYLSGADFFKLKPGQQITLVYGDGSTETYQIDGFEQFQALAPTSPYSQFVNLNDPSGSQITSTELFYQLYGGANQLVLQTCIKAFGEPSWGRLFILATRVN